MNKKHIEIVTDILQGNLDIKSISVDRNYIHFHLDDLSILSIHRHKLFGDIYDEWYKGRE